MRASLGLGRWLIFCVFGLLGALLAGCGGGGDNGDGGASVDPGIQATSITISPANTSLAKGLTQQMIATGHFNNGSSRQLTSGVTWSTSAPTIVSVTPTGLASALGADSTANSAKISASYNGLEADTTVTVGPAKVVEVQVTPADAQIAASAKLPKGTGAQLVATALYSDNGTLVVTNDANWVSATPEAVSVNNSDKKGYITADEMSETAVPVTATFKGVSGSFSITSTAATLKSIAVGPTSAKIAKGGFVQPFTATGTYSDDSKLDITKQVTWILNNDNNCDCAAIDGHSGVATSHAAAGTAKITAELGGVTSQPAVTLTVSADQLKSIAVTPPNADLVVGEGKQFKAVGSFGSAASTPDADVTTLVKWTTSDPTILAFDDARPGYAVSQKASAVAGQLQTVTATFGNDPSTAVSGTATATVASSLTRPVEIQITPNDAQLPKGGFQRRLSAIGIYADGSAHNVTTQVTWTTSDSSKATVSNTTSAQGLVTSGNAGAATISAGWPNSSVKGAATLTVTDATLTSIAVNPPSATIPLGLVPGQQFSATGKFTDGSTLDLMQGYQVIWSSLDTNIVDFVYGGLYGRGFASALAQGSTAVRATSAIANTNVRSADVPVTVIQESVGYIDVYRGIVNCDDLSVGNFEGQLRPGASYQYTACAITSTGDVHDVTAQAAWITGDASVATVSDKGKVKAVAHGTTVVRATIGTKSGEKAVTVDGAPSSGDFPRLVITPIQALSFSNTSRSDIQLNLLLAGDEDLQEVYFVTPYAQWSGASSLPASAVNVSNDVGSKGQVSVVAPLVLLPETVTITASYGGLTPAVKTISVSP